MLVTPFGLIAENVGT